MEEPTKRLGTPLTFPKPTPVPAGSIPPYKPSPQLRAYQEQLNLHTFWAMAQMRSGRLLRLE